MRGLGVATAFLALGACASAGPCDVRAIDGFYAPCTQTTLKEHYGLGVVLPVPEAEFVATMSSLGLRTSYEGRPQDSNRAKPIPQYPRHLRDAPISHVIRVSGGLREGPPRHNEQYIAYVIDGQVVAVENQLGFYGPF